MRVIPLRLSGDVAEDLLEQLAEQCEDDTERDLLATLASVGRLTKALGPERTVRLFSLVGLMMPEDLEALAVPEELEDLDELDEHRADEAVDLADRVLFLLRSEGGSPTSSAFACMMVAARILACAAVGAGDHEKRAEVSAHSHLAWSGLYAAAMEDAEAKEGLSGEGVH